jgi:hypothetical protein
VDEEVKDEEEEEWKGKGRGKESEGMKRGRNWEGGR